MKKLKAIFLLFIIIIYSQQTLNAKSILDLSENQRLEYAALTQKLISPTPKIKPLHIIQNVSKYGITITLEDQSQWNVGFWHQDTAQHWKKGDQVYLEYDWSLNNDILITNTKSKNTAWATFSSPPANCKIPRIVNILSQLSTQPSIILNNGMTLIGPANAVLVDPDWKITDRIFIYQNNENQYQLWNLDTGSIVSNCKLQKYINPILALEEKLNKKVIHQKEACKAVSDALLNYTAGLKRSDKPIGSFLFLGPTGVGKTELAKALTDELFANDRSYLIRFDMSHFNEKYTVTRLFGSPPGYLGFEEGGQMTEALLKKPHSVVLLDEMEKAHPEVHKCFLPVFDEGYIKDARNNFVHCNNVIFIMTSNLCGPEIASLSKKGYDNDDILAAIEPILIQKLSPELYNRLEPIVFSPLGEDAMEELVELMLKQLIDRIYKEKEILLVIDGKVKEYLIENGFHPTLGARPLGKLIEKKIVSTLAFGIIKDGVSAGSTVSLFYDDSQDKFFLEAE